MADDVVQPSSASNYDILRIIPMIGDDIDIQEFSNQEIVPKTTPKVADFYHYGNCDMSVGVNHCIVYAKAQDATPTNGVSSKAHNGSLNVFYNSTLSEGLPTISNETEISKISFEPVSMLGNTTAPAEAVALATYLTNITNASVTAFGSTYYWKSHNNNVLKKLFENFTNYENGNYNVIPGSAANVREWVSQLKAALEGYDLFTEGSIEDMLRDEIVDLCKPTSEVAIVEIDDNTYNINDLTYPRDVDLPDGAALLKWNSTNNEFEPQTETTTLANISTITRYAYPPELYFFVDSDIRCKEEQVNYQELYGKNEIDTWIKFLEAAGFLNSNSGDDITAVTESTRAVALKDPVQYAVAHLQVNVQAKPTATGGTTFKDAADKDITIGTEKFPLTGVIVGGQKPLDFKFVPTTSIDANVKFVYDSQVNTYDSENGTYAHYLSTSESETTNTLVLQSVDAEDVTFILEFENKSGALFHGVNNEIIYPDTRFYMVGEIICANGSGGDEKSTGRVFTKAYTTVVNATVGSLAEAYNVLPNILSSNLEIGVETTPQWIAATPSTVILE